MFYIKANNKMQRPKEIYVKQLGTWKKVIGVYANQQLRKASMYEKEELKLSRNKRGLLDRIKKFEEIGETVGRTAQEEADMQKLIKLVNIIRIEMTELNKNRKIIENERYFKNKIIPGETFIRALKVLTNNGETRFKVIKMVPYGRLLERPLTIFNTENDFTLDKVFYRILDTNIKSTSVEITEIQNLVGPKATFTVHTPNVLANELTDSMVAHEKHFYDQMEQIESQFNYVKYYTNTVKSYFTELDLENSSKSTIPNYDPRNNIVIGEQLRKSRKISSIDSLSTTSPDIVAQESNLSTRKGIAKALHDTNIQDRRNYDTTNLIDAKYFSDYKFGLLPGNTPIEEQIDETKLIEGTMFIQSDDTTFGGCEIDDSINTIY